MLPYSRSIITTKKVIDSRNKKTNYELQFNFFNLKVSYYFRLICKCEMSTFLTQTENSLIKTRRRLLKINSSKLASDSLAFRGP